MTGRDRGADRAGDVGPKGRRISADDFS